MRTLAGDVKWHTAREVAAPCRRRVLAHSHAPTRVLLGAFRPKGEWLCASTRCAERTLEVFVFVTYNHGSGTARPRQPMRSSVPSSPEERQQQYWELSVACALDCVQQAARVRSVPPRAAVLRVVNSEAGAQGTHSGGAKHLQECLTLKYVHCRLSERRVQVQPGELAPSPFVSAESGRDAPLYVPPRVAPQRLEPHVLRSLGQESKTSVEQRDGIGGQVGGHHFTEPQLLHRDRQRIRPEAGVQQIRHEPQPHEQVHHISELGRVEAVAIHLAEDAASALAVAAYCSLAEREERGLSAGVQVCIGARSSTPDDQASSRSYMALITFASKS